MTFLAATSGIMAVLMIGLPGGPALTAEVSLYSLLVTAAILAVRVLVQVFRPSPG